MDEEPTTATPSTFSLPYPLWVCVNKDAPDSLFGGNLTGGGRFIVIFTHGEIAVQFLVRRQKLNEAEIHDIPDKTKFLGFLNYLLEIGISHVVFDDTGIREEAKRIVKIESLLAKIGELKA